MTVYFVLFALYYSHSCSHLVEQR